MQHLNYISIHERETLPTSRKSPSPPRKSPTSSRENGVNIAELFSLPPHPQFSEKGAEELLLSQNMVEIVDMGWKEWVAYPFAISTRREVPGVDVDAHRRTRLLYEFMATMCEIWIGAGISMKGFALRGLMGFRGWRGAMERWLRVMRRSMCRVQKKTE
ncbi:hypothetical protein SBOR_1480 [Sclerotinia borealis F-4128]|uniref:Uncharacterized protein n=1 Tax=Sclerotinia borealis (strain F-4128) TaxID=1432307 RepID=W9CQH7_SCLBF|nr:hypothetical protein SBOR_1480 [Sclerotinia borealis F-4128]